MPDSGEHLPGPVFDRVERLKIATLLGLILAATAVAFALLVVLAAHYDQPARGALPAITFGTLGILAYTLGLRHAVDADHIAAIDNTTRKLLQEGKRPLTVGSWFSLGHSTVVVAMILAFVVATQALVASFPTIKSVGADLGAVISGTFLWIIGLVNLVIAIEIYRTFRGLKEGRYDQKGLEEQLLKRGFLNRYFGRLFRVVERPVQIYPIGLLFGLGFDTTSEVLLIATTVGLVTTTGGVVPIYAVLVLPLLFTLGMVLIDTADGITMRYAYGWAFSKPLRKVYYNLTVTVISVLVALVIGTLELLQVLAANLAFAGPVVAFLNGFNITTAGYSVVGIFVGTWLLAMAYYRYKRYDELALEPTPTSAVSGGPTT